MTEDYYSREKNEKKSINNSNYFLSNRKNSLNNSNHIAKTASLEGSKTIYNTEDSNGFDGMTKNEEDIDHLRKFQLEKENNPFLINTNRNNSLNSNKIPYFSLTNSFQSKSQLNRQISGKIPHPRKTHANIPINQKKMGISFFQNKRNSSGERPSTKKLESKYTSVSENKYQFIHRITENQKYGMNDFSHNNIPKINYKPIDSSNVLMNYSNNKKINIMNSSGQKIKNPKNSDNTINDIYSNSNDIVKEHQNISIKDNINKKEFNNAEKRAVNNKKSSNFDYNTINGNKLQDNIQLVKIEQNNNNQEQKKLISNSKNNTTNNYPLKNVSSFNNMNINSKSFTNIPKQNSNYSVNSSNILSQRLTTVGYKYLNNQNRNISPYFRTFTQKDNNEQNQPLKYNNIKNTKSQKEPEIAIVTKISSSNDNNLINNNEKKIINQNIEQIFKRNNNYYNINNSQIYNNQISKTSQSQMLNKDSNNYLTQEEINKILGQADNQLIKSNMYISPSTSTIQKENIQSGSNYITNVNKIFYQNNFNEHNINQIYNQTQNFTQNFNRYNHHESERLTIIKNKNDMLNRNIPKLNNNINFIYNNINGKGLLKNCNGLSQPGKDASGKTKTNQDSFVCKTNINNIKDFNIFGVLDGHGPDGHFVSEFASEFIPSQIINNVEIKNLSTQEKIYMKLKENNCKIINQAFLTIDKHLKNMQFDVSESGCTCCLVIQIGTHLICANTGDSRAIVVYDQANQINTKNLNYLDFVPLSVDYKPELPEEISRIILAGGVVEQMKDEYGEGIGPYRVWVKGKDYPGLAMSRSIGDLKGKTVGVIPDPGILEYDLTKSTKYIIVCSDGVWEFLNNEIVMNLGKKFYLQNNPVNFCNELISKALKEWEKNESIIDDITAVVAFF